MPLVKNIEDIQLVNLQFGLLKNGDREMLLYRPYGKDNPFYWTTDFPSDVNIPAKIPKKRYNDEVKKYTNICLSRGYTIDQLLKLPLFQEFPKVAQNKTPEQLCKLYGMAIWYKPSKFHSVFPVQLNADDYTPWKVIPKDTFTFHGRGESKCEAPTLRPEPFWVFMDKSNAYMYTRTDKFPSAGEGCWVITTFRTTRDLRLLNLGLREIRHKLKKHLKQYNLNLGDEKLSPLTLTDEDYEANCTGDNLITYSFPSKNTRVSHGGIDYVLANILKDIFPNLDGWYIPYIGTFPAEIVLFNPIGAIVEELTETWDYNRLKDMLSRCMTTNGQSKCEDLITKAFRENRIVCLIKKDIIQCYLIEELMREKNFKRFQKEAARGYSYIQLV